MLPAHASALRAHLRAAWKDIAWKKLSSEILSTVRRVDFPLFPLPENPVVQPLPVPSRAADLVRSWVREREDRAVASALSMGCSVPYEPCCVCQASHVHPGGCESPVAPAGEGQAQPRWRGRGVGFLRR